MQGVCSWGIGDRQPLLIVWRTRKAGSCSRQAQMGVPHFLAKACRWPTFLGRCANEDLRSIACKRAAAFLWPLHIGAPALRLQQLAWCLRMIWRTVRLLD